MSAALPPGWEQRWLDIDGRRLFVRRSATPSDAVPVVHVHGFGISGRYLMPTAELLTDAGLRDAVRREFEARGARRRRRRGGRVAVRRGVAGGGPCCGGE